MRWLPSLTPGRCGKRRITYVLSRGEDCLRGKNGQEFLFEFLQIRRTSWGIQKRIPRPCPPVPTLAWGVAIPLPLASLQDGETVLDLGSGAGFDCFLAAQAVGASGRGIGVDMTPEMLRKARENAAKGGFTNVEFRLGEIEHLPVADQTVDVIISHCVINLSPEKSHVFRDAFRVLKPSSPWPSRMSSPRRPFLRRCRMIWHCGPAASLGLR